MVATEKNSKKRSAPSQSGPKAKRAQAEKVKTPAPTPKADKGKKRSQPVTLPEENEADSEEDYDQEDELDVNEAEGLNEDGDEMDVDEAEGSTKVKDPNASRESHKAQKALLSERKASKPHSVLLSQAKAAWTLARQKNISKAERTKYVEELMEIIRGNVKDIVFKHDASRIVQTAVKYGGEKERNEIAEELKGRYKDLAQSKYSKFLVTKLIRFCPAHRAPILREFQGQVLRLLLHREASSVLADAFELYANAYERALLLRDFYGKEASLVTITAGSDAEREAARKGLRGVLESMGIERRKRVLGALKEGLVTVFNNSDKGAVAHAVVHRALWEYLSALSGLEDEAEQEKLRREMFEICQDVLAEMVHTKDGSRVVREFLARGSAKDRKHITKAIKPHVVRMAKDDEAQLVLFTALDVLDDTKLSAKSIAADIAASASALYESPQGRRSLIYLVAPRTRRHFTPAQIALLEETDPIRAQTSKKDNDLRAVEIKRAASESLLAWVSEKGAEVSRDPGGSLVVCEIMLETEGEKSAASDTLLGALASLYPSPVAEHPHPISFSHTARMHKTLLQGGHYSHATRAVVLSPAFDAHAYAVRFVQRVGPDATRAMARAEGAFVVAALCEQLASKETSERATLKGWFDDGVRKEIRKSEGRGLGLVLEKLELL